MTNEYRNVLYIGVTSNLQKRIWQHQHHEFPTAFTGKYNTNQLIYYEGFDNISQAIAREKQIKKWTRAKKDELISRKNPSLKNLFEEVMMDVYSLL